MILIRKKYFTPDFITDVLKLLDDKAVEATFNLRADTKIVAKGIRDSKVRWIEEEDSPVIYNWLKIHLCHLSHDIGLPVTKFTGPLQLTHYGVAGHYTWHPDKGHGNGRVSSFIIMLSDYGNYEGGELEMKNEKDQTYLKLKLDAGDMVIFDSTIWHRVTPVAVGERITLVGWLE